MNADQYINKTMGFAEDVKRGTATAAAVRVAELKETAKFLARPELGLLLVIAQLSAEQQEQVLRVVETTYKAGFRTGEQTTLANVMTLMYPSPAGSRSAS